jgi:hypothetical protein
MKNKNSDETTLPFNDIPPETVRLAYSIHVYGREETICQFSSNYDIPLGLRQSHLNSTWRAFGILFEHAVQVPMLTATREFIEGRLKQKRKENCAKPTEASVGSNLPGDMPDPSPQNSPSEPWNTVKPQGGAPTLPTPRPWEMFRANPEVPNANPPSQTPGNKELKNAA